MQNIFKTIIFSIVLFIPISSVYGDSLIEKVTVPNSYIVAYINFDEIHNSSLFKYINKLLERADHSKVNQTKFYKNILKILKKYNLKESDFNEFAATIGLKDPNITSLDDFKKDDINFAFGFLLIKDISFVNLNNITEDVIKNDNKLTSSVVEYKKEKYIKIVNGNETFYITTLPQKKIILGSETRANLYLLINNIKNDTHILFTPELKKIESKLNKKSDSYFALALPSSITKNIAANISFKNKGIRSIDTNIFKNIMGLTLQADINSDLVLRLNSFFADSMSAKAFDLLLNQFIPTFKMMLFISAEGSLPMLNEVKFFLSGGNVVDFHIKISKQDIKTLYKFIILKLKN